jgi:hypothetical protein
MVEKDEFKFPALGFLAKQILKIINSKLKLNALLVLLDF